MSPLKRWTTMAAATMFVGLMAQTALTAQEPTLPKDGQALATQLGLSSDAAKPLMSNLDKLASALTRGSAIHEQAMAVRTDMHEALTSLMPELTSAQRQQLMSALRRDWMPGLGMGRGMHQGMGQGMHQGMGQGMHQGMGPANCPYLKANPQGDDSTSAGGTPQGR